VILSEIGTDLSAFAHEKNFVSWLGVKRQLFFPINDNYNSRFALDPIQRQRQLLFPIGWPTDLARMIRRAVRFTRWVKRRWALRGRNLPRDNPADGVPPGTWLRGSNHARGVFFCPPRWSPEPCLKKSTRIPRDRSIPSLRLV
jgi:hypothetical protein